ncbi:Transmembrane protein 51 [Oryzias melastigma]|uniref:Transmembrane protein 51 n=1 Tax=Oryzias melastigma TaxID=30732 RepID=A0A3B3D356_ORYME|nr:transmembrane protein 51a [Oryzias melastigma]XP_036068547.1 transmembrane protein 51a [Oryzias melastigma]KAF6735477.1 Transmembrane protein 51 [Oryzias melastigma]
MRSSVDGHPHTLGSGETNGNSGSSSSNNNNNNNNHHHGSNENIGNSGSQYALCALGVGLIALSVVMIVWSVVPSDVAFNNSSSGSGEGGVSEEKRNKASSVAFVLIGSGVAMLLLSLCLGMRNKRRAQLRLQEAQNQRQETSREQERQIAEEQAQRYAVPTYEEAVSSGQYPVRQSNFRPSTSQLPSYEDLVTVDGIRYENEESGVITPTTQPAPATAAAPNHRPGKTNRTLLPIKIRRIKSEKLPMKNAPLPTTGSSIEPLTPPPQYEDKVPPL